MVSVTYFDKIVINVQNAILVNREKSDPFF